MKYVLLMYANDSNAPKSPEALQAIGKDYTAFLKEASAAKVLESSHGIAPGTSATTIRVREGKTLTTDGPFAETHEQLGGFFLVECQDLDEALRWAAKIPVAKYGSIEVRPLWSPKQ